MAHSDFAGGRLLLPAEHAQQRGFSRAVNAHQRNTVAAVDGEADIIKHTLGSALRAGIVLGQVLDIEHRAAGSKAAAEI